MDKNVEAGSAYRTAAVIGGYWKNWCKASLEFGAASSKEDDVLFCARKCIETGSDKKESDNFILWAHISIADILNQRSVYEESLSHARDAVALDRSSAWAYAAEADAFFGLRRFQETVNAAKQAIRLSDGKFGTMHFRLGTAYFELENWEFARQSFETAAKLQPTDDASAYNVALCLARLGFYRDAATWFEEVLRRDPNRKDRQELLNRISILRGR